jgi:5-oxoprolinase (ATP-hydrolysing)/N-methylhydantoinase A
MPTDPSPRYRLGFDIGGTFTDFVLFDAATGAIRLHKCLTTPQDPAVGALAGIAAITAAAGITLAEISELLHGTTLVTNALIERRGAMLGLITTQGFRDILEFGIEQRYDIYDLFLKFQNAVHKCFGPRWASADVDIDGNDLVDTLNNGGVPVVRPAAGGASTH